MQVFWYKLTKENLLNKMKAFPSCAPSTLHEVPPKNPTPLDWSQPSHLNRGSCISPSLSVPTLMTDSHEETDHFSDTVLTSLYRDSKTHDTVTVSVTVQPEAAALKVASDKCPV